MAIILPANTLASGGYEVANSCRFNRGDSADLQKTWSGTPTSQKKYTFSFWIKRCGTGTIDWVMDTAGTFSLFNFTASDTFEWAEYVGGAYKYRILTNRLFRDPSAWYHFCCRYDSTDGTAGDRQRLYINGVEETSFSTDTNPGLNYDSIVNSAISHTIGSQQAEGAANYADEYLSEVVFIDGSSLAPTSFGEFDEDSPTIWKPIDVSGLTFGTNGFYLDFEDSANLGNDANGGTDWTEANLDATDSATDVPTNNFCTWNPLENFYFDGVYSEGNTKVVTDGSKFSFNQASIGVSSGKWYWEVEPTAKGAGATDLLIGVTSTPSTNTGHTLGYYANDVGYRGSGNKKINNSDSSYGNTYDVNDIIGVALDLDNNKLYFSKAGTFQDSGDPTSGATGTGAISITDPASTTIGFYFPSISYVHDSATATFEANFGNPSVALDSGNADANGYGAFEYAPPSGYFALCTKNLAEFG